MIIYRENSEDIYAGIEWASGTPECKKVISFLIDEMGVTGIRFPDTAGIGVKPVSSEGTKRLVRCAIEHAIEHKRPTVTIVHKGNIMKFTEGGFKDWAYEVAREEFGGELIDGGPWTKITTDDGFEILVKDVIADAMLQQILLRPAEYDVIATLNLNGDYISDALAAMVGGIGIAPGANIKYDTGEAIFEATHGTAPKYAGQDKVNPSSVILSGVMMFDYMGWPEAGALIVKGIEGAIARKTVTYDFHRLMDGATKLKCSEFGTAIIENMEPMTYKRPKIALVGAGQIGGIMALLCAQKELGDVVLLDIPRMEGQAKGKALDIMQGRPVDGYDAQVTGTSDYADIAGAEVVIVTAGVPRKPGMSRDDLLDINLKIIRDVAANLKQHCPDAFVIVITNPLDAMVWTMQKETGFPASKVCGMAGVLDSARLAFLLADSIGISVGQVQALTLGGHGPSMVPLISTANAGGVPVTTLLDSDTLAAIVARTRGAGEEIVGLLGNGSAFFSPAASAVKMAEAYLKDQKAVLPAAAYLSGEYGFNGIYFGVPTIIGAGGVERIIEVPLSDAERTALDASAGAVSALIAEIK